MAEKIKTLYETKQRNGKRHMICRNSIPDCKYWKGYICKEWSEVGEKTSAVLCTSCTAKIAGAPEVKLIVTEISHEERTITAVPQWKNAKRQYGNKGLPSRDLAWKGQNIVFLDDHPFGLSDRLAGIARRRSDNPNDISNQMNVRQRQHAANDEEGAVNPESDD